jgi:hypothetical protein
LTSQGGDAPGSSKLPTSVPLPAAELPSLLLEALSCGKGLPVVSPVLLLLLLSLVLLLLLSLAPLLPPLLLAASAA